MLAATGRALILLVLASACASTRLVPMAPQTPRELPRYSDVVLKTGRRVQLAEGRLTADSLLGARRSGERFAVSRDSVAAVEQSSFSAGRTLGVLGGLVLALLALTLSVY